MKSTYIAIGLLSVCLYTLTGCSPKQVYMLNKTGGEILLYMSNKEIPSADRPSLKYRILKENYAIYLGVAYGGENKEGVTDLNCKQACSNILTISGSDTLFFSKQQVINKLNDGWHDVYKNTTKKERKKGKNNLIWELNKEHLQQETTEN